jgi:ABC-type sugar transport system substrate-binding protein
MRALTRMRTLAAACALLLFVSGMAAAWAPERPIDRTDSPPPSPTEVGDPDTGQGLVYWRQLLIVAQLTNPWFSRLAIHGLESVSLRLSVSAVRLRGRLGR